MSGPSNEPVGEGLLTIVTGADRSHFRSLCQLLSSAAEHEPDAPLIVYDLGLEPEQVTIVRELFDHADLVTFDFGAYPSYFDMSVERGCYAWKPVCVDDAFRKAHGDVIWFDAGCILTEPLTRIREVLAGTGIYSPVSAGTVADWTHPTTLAYLQAEPSILRRCNFSAGCVGVSRPFENRYNLIGRWRDCSLTKACIAPDGSHRGNHRQDQAVLTVLIHQLGLPETAPRQKLGFRTHQDINGPDQLRRFDRKLLLQVRSGLANRLRTLLSAQLLAERFGRRLHLVWRPDEACGAAWRDLFEDPIDEVAALPEGTRVMNGADLQALHRALASAHSTVSVSDIRSLLRGPSRHRAAGRLETLEPSEKVRRSVDSVVGHFSGEVMGVHVRRVDFARYLWGKGAALPGLEQYYEHLDGWHGQFYLATDGGPDVELEFRRRYGDRLIVQAKSAQGRDSVAAIREALVDLLVLRQCDRLVGTKYSSFTSLAHRVDGSCVRVVRPLPWEAVPEDLGPRIAAHYHRCLRHLAGPQSPRE